MASFLAIQLVLTMALYTAPPTTVTADSLTTVDPALLTVAESSDYTATATSAQVTELAARLLKQSTILRVTEMGRTFEDKPIPLLILANPPVESAQTARASGKAIAFIMANIHAGEVEGKEASLRLAREIALDPNQPLLKNLVIVIAPNYNADGNDKMALDSRPGQVGPEKGQGQRPNAQNLDLNRDYIKLEAPESRALVKFLTEWDPDITVDCHTTNGSHHRYTLTYEAPLNPSGAAEPIDFVRNTLLPEVTRRVRESTGYEMWHYGNFNRDHTVWETYSAQPRFGGPYQGLRGQMSILSEAYSYATYKDRCLCTHAFLLEILKYTSENADRIREINHLAERNLPAIGDLVGIRHTIAACADKAIVKGYANAVGGEGGAAADPAAELGSPKDYECTHMGRFEPTLSVLRPWAYIIPPGFDKVVENLRMHGIWVDSSTRGGKGDGEVYTITKIDRAERKFQGHRTVEVEATVAKRPYDIAPGSFIVKTNQPLGTLAIYLLEPQSEDGLTTWNFLDDHLEVGREFPIVRMPVRPKE